MFNGVGVSCRILYSTISCLYVSCSGSNTSVGEEKANLPAINYLYVVSVRRNFLFLLVLGMGCVILMWHSMSLPYNYYLLSVCLFFKIDLFSMLPSEI